MPMLSQVYKFILLNKPSKGINMHTASLNVALFARVLSDGDGRKWTQNIPFKLHADNL